MKKLMNLISLGVAAYGFYKAVSRFLETEQGQVLKEKATDYYDVAVGKLNTIATGKDSIDLSWEKK